MENLIRNCPKCGKEIQYKSKGGYFRVIKTNATCKNCSRDNMRAKDENMVYTRQCPNCNKEIIYKNKKTYNNAICKNSLCISCVQKGKNNPMYGIII